MNNKLFALGLLAVISLVACKKSETTTPTVSTETNDTVSLTKPETDTKEHLPELLLRSKDRHHRSERSR